MSDKDKQPINVDLPQAIEDGIGHRIKAARESKSLSQSDVHRVTGISRMVLSKYEAGQNKPGTRELRLLCDALDVSPNYLIYGSESTHTKSENLSDLVMGLKGDGAIIATSLLPLIGSVIGRDDTRKIFDLIESLVKAKSPRDYELLTRLVKVACTYNAKRVDEANWLINGEFLVEDMHRVLKVIFDKDS